MKLKIGARLLATFGVVLVFLFAICVTATAQMARMSATTQTIVSIRAQELKLVNAIRAATLKRTVLLYAALDEPSPEAQQAALEQVQEICDQLTPIYQAIPRLLTTAAGRASFDRLLQARELYQEATKPVFAQLAAHDIAVARAAPAKARSARIAFFAAARRVSEFGPGLDGQRREKHQRRI
ncbi:MCP four helix bundle domain-containing protein [Paraburkholderia sp. BR10936]|uniref:MCP four helix bundle domain-containing protein n=1 Tax=Paraburkholderia sp. BR10936 TaxID=3236993 RepID=UPI0034D26DE3